LGMLAIIVFVVVIVFGFGFYALALNVGGRGMLILSLMILLAGFAISLFSIGAIGQAEAAPVTVHTEHTWGSHRDTTFDWATLKADPYFQAFAGVVVALIGCAGCVGCAFSKAE
jgi:multisubunit Na+/H+ antiporter MnhC subunit